MEQKRTRFEDDAFVLHMRVYKNTSLILSLLTKGHGHIRAVAHGALRTYKNGTVKKPLDLFRYYYCYLQTSGNLHTLFEYQQKPPIVMIHPKHMLLMHYCNQLLLRSLPTSVAVGNIFTHYYALIVHLHDTKDTSLELLCALNSLLDIMVDVLCHAASWRSLLPPTVQPEVYYQFDDAGLQAVPYTPTAIFGNILLAACDTTLTHQAQKGRSSALMDIIHCLRTGTGKNTQSTTAAILRIL